jgi:PKD repeat protein
MTATVATFIITPETRVDGGDIRFVPYVQNNLSPIVTYAWNFGDGAVSATPTPIHTYGATTYTFTASLIVTDAGGHATGATTNFVVIDETANIPAVPTNGSFYAVSVCVYDATDSMVINRNTWGISGTSGCDFYLLKPKITQSIDKIGVATFSVLTPGTTALNTYMQKQLGLLKEGANVLIILGQDITFSGIIRRVSQDKQSGFGSTTRVQLFDVECDSDLARLKKISVKGTALPTTGDIIIDSPANIFRRIMS